jgi:mannitol/fructose-specific phosphotransferase system IIA component (Ntr-type)
MNETMSPASTPANANCICASKPETKPAVTAAAPAPQDCVPDVLPFYQAALNHELLSDSANGLGIAIAHARLGGVKHLRFALGRANQPVIWNTKGSWPMQLIFLLAVPATDAASYLHLLSCLVRLGRDPETLADLLAASDAPGVLAVLRKIMLQ